ncbi:MAG TPA: hypothetical protein VK783_14870 [Bacteroidia bacterium]|jgi:hypothetical protein|nr:hypothetical protein [Bacteroidia bacterium]
MKAPKNNKNSSKLWYTLFVAMFFVLLGGTVHAQDANSDDVKNHVQEHSASAKLSPAQKKLEKAKKAQEKKAAKAQKAALKQHMKNQSPDTRKRMKADAKEAKRNRDHTKEFFLKRWFTKKPAK